MNGHLWRLREGKVFSVSPVSHLEHFGCRTEKPQTSYEFGGATYHRDTTRRLGLDRGKPVLTNLQTGDNNNSNDFYCSSTLLKALYTHVLKRKGCTLLVSSEERQNIFVQFPLVGRFLFKSAFPLELNFMSGFCRLPKLFGRMYSRSPSVPPNQAVSTNPGSMEERERLLNAAPLFLLFFFHVCGPFGHITSIQNFPTCRGGAPSSSSVAVRSLMK